MDKNPKVFIAGSTGLLGRHLVAKLKSTATVFAHGHNQNAEFRANLIDADETKILLDSIDPEIVINLVALTNVDDCEKQHQRAYDLNIGVPQNLAQWCKARNRVLIHISSDQLYDGPPCAKEHQVKVLNNYALTKFAGELPVLWADGIVLRTNFFGTSLSTERASFSDWLRSSFQNNSAINLFNDVFFSPLQMETLCTCIEKVLFSPTPGVYNLGSHDGMSKEEFARIFAKSLGYQTINATSVSFKDVKLLAQRPSEMRMDVSKFEAVFGIQLPSLADEILRESKHAL